MYTVLLCGGDALYKFTANNAMQRKFLTVPIKTEHSVPMPTVAKVPQLFVACTSKDVK